MKSKQNKDQQNSRTDKGRGQKEEETKIYLTSDSTLQTEEEHRHDQQVDPSKDKDISVSRDDLKDIKAGKLTGRESIDERSVSEE
ncbi:MAG: hypothetical protein H0V91_08255 [Flavisolibacter sp.]|jgi:hypothetical protein|nr:hypothetical protein [Flavisolibacter sp.]